MSYPQLASCMQLECRAGARSLGGWVQPSGRRDRGEYAFDMRVNDKSELLRDGTALAKSGSQPGGDNSPGVIALSRSASWCF